MASGVLTQGGEEVSSTRATDPYQRYMGSGFNGCLMKRRAV